MPLHLPDWVQGALFESQLAEIHLWFGIMTEPDHNQVQVETRDPISNQLLDLCSMPHVTSSHLRKLLVYGFVQSMQHLLTNVDLTLDAREDVRRLQLQIEALETE